MRRQTRLGTRVGLALVMAGCPLSALAQQAPEAEEPPAPEVQPAAPDTSQTAVSPQQQAQRDRTKAAALRAQARGYREQLTSNPDLLREYVLYQYTGDARLTPRVADVTAKAAAADQQAHELELRSWPPATAE
jgi:hypothetical protein